MVLDVDAVKQIDSNPNEGIFTKCSAASNKFRALLAELICGILDDA